MLIAQISDCHVVDPGDLFADRIDSSAALRSAVDTINALELQPDLVIGTGDLVNDGTSVQYDRLAEALAGLRAPFVPFPGNHDDRSELRRRYADVLPAGEPTDPIDVVIDLPDLAIVAIDTTIPGSNEGTLSDAQLRWLDEQLTAIERPVVVVQHHPPVPSGVGHMDAACGFDTGRAEAAVISGHRHVEAVICGHLHRSFQCRYAGTVLVVCPSTAGQLALELDGGVTHYTAEPTGFVLHHWRAGVGLISHTVPVGRFDRWRPSWSM
jgi:3',5'-cyclic AMP phosphodiesterase CpdA